MKRVTLNFQALREMSDAEADDLLKRCKDSGRPYEYDRRNGIYCIEPTRDIICYKNYLDYLNSCYNEWKSYGYFDMGMIPLIMAPSFMQDAMNSALMAIVENWKIQVFSMRPVSLLGGTYIGSKDAWVRRRDFAMATGMDVNTASLSDYLNRILSEVRAS